MGCTRPGAIRVPLVLIATLSACRTGADAPVASSSIEPGRPGLTASRPQGGAPTPAPTLTIDRLFSGEFDAAGFGPARWLKNGRLATLEPAQPGPGHELVGYDPASGDRTVLIAARELTPEGAEAPLRVADYAFSADDRKVLVFTNTRRVWRYHTRGDYWVLDRDRGSLRRLGRTLESARLQFAKFSPDGSRVAYVHRSDLYIEDLASGAITRLTRDGSDTLVNGTFDWVYEEEWGLRDGFRFSPDGESIAFWQIDSSGVGVFNLVDNISGPYSKVTPIPYPKVGTVNPAARVGVVPAAGGAVRWMDVPGDPRDDYIAKMEWASSSRELVIQRINRLQNTNRVMLLDAATGAARTVFTDRDETWVEACDDFRWFDGGKRFLWVSESDGWRHVSVVSRDGKESRLVTPGDYDVIRIEHVDAKGGWLYFLASPRNATRRFLYRANLDVPGPPERLTEAPRGIHDYQISPDGRWAIHTGSSFGVPPTVDIVALPEHRTVRRLVDNAELRDKLAAAGLGAHEFFRVDIGQGVELDGWRITPPGFDESKRYPVIVHVYGEPAAQTVLDRYGVGHYLWHQMMAQRGYVVYSVDNRGTPAPKGRAWRRSVYRKIGITAAIDQAAALRALQERWPFLDPDRVGVWGWSGGGSMTLNALFRYPELYHAGVAIAFVANQRYYDTIYQERYMGLPDDNAEGFRDGSPITRAKNLRGDLLLVYGTGDDNCHYQNCEALVDELVAHDKHFEMLSYPNRTHSISQGRNTRRHMFRRMARFFDEKVRMRPVSQQR